METIGIIATACLVTYTRQISNHLPSGVTGEDTLALRQEASTVPKSINSIGESQFALLKHLRNFKSNASVQHLETGILWAYNKTGEWLAAQCRRSQFTIWMETMKIKERQRLEKVKRASIAQQKSIDSV